MYPLTKREVKKCLWNPTGPHGNDTYLEKRWEDRKRVVIRRERMQNYKRFHPPSILPPKNQQDKVRTKLESLDTTIRRTHQ